LNILMFPWWLRTYRRWCVYSWIFGSLTGRLTTYFHMTKLISKLFLVSAMPKN
jgi:hypothetical protein